jgi:TonB dependent receptor
VKAAGLACCAALLATGAASAQQPDAGTADPGTTVSTPRLRREVGAPAVFADEAKALPLALGDAATVVQNLPGVARAPAGASGLVVFGASSEETRIVIDDVPVPWLFHRGGLRSALSDAYLGSVELLPAGFGPRHGRATGALVQVSTAAPSGPGLGGSLGVDLVGVGVSAQYQQPQDQGPHAALLAGRFGWLGQLLPLVAPELQQSVAMPTSWDYGGKWLVRAGESQTQLQLFGAGDQVQRPFSTGRGQLQTSWFHRAALRHQQPLLGGGWVDAGLWLGVDRDRTDSDFGGGAGSLADTLAWRGGGRASLRQPLVTGAVLTLGVDLEGARTEARRLGSLAVPAREGDLAFFGQPPGDAVAEDAWTTHQLGVAGYAELELSAGRIFTVRPGVRLEPNVVEGQRLVPSSAAGIDVGFSRFELLAEPRLAVLFRPVPELSVSAAAGLYHQPPAATDLSATFGNTQLGSSTGFHALLEVDAQPARVLHVELAGYFRAVSGLATRNPSSSPSVAQALVGTGEGRSYGAQLVLRPASWRWLSGWVSYALSRSERRSASGAAWRLFDGDQTHQVAAVASVELPLGFRLGARLRAGSGTPRTPVVGAALDARTGAWQPLRGEHNSARLAPFFQLDLKAERAFVWKAARLTLALDVVNVTNTRNQETMAYSFDYRDEQPVLGLPILAMLGARLEL